MTTKDSSRSIREGVYAFVAGPTYETRAECRMLHSLGADMVGMSTVPEIIVARHSGIKILALSLVTNNAVLQPVARGDDATLQNMTPGDMEAHLSKGKATHQEVLEAGKQAANDMQVSRSGSTMMVVYADHSRLLSRRSSKDFDVLNPDTRPLISS